MPLDYLASKAKHFDPLYTARCHCGAIVYAVAAPPVDAKICHCRDCRVLHGAPMQWAAIFAKADVRFIRGVERLRFYHAASGEARHELPCKVGCDVCGSWIADEGRRMWLAFPTLFDFPAEVPRAFQPTCHIFYSQRVVDAADDLPKWSGHKQKSDLIA